MNISRDEFDSLLIKSKKGDPEAFNQLSVYISDVSISYFESKKRTGKIINQEDVEDLSNSVYLAFAEQYHKIENLENWLRRVLFLSFIRWYKRNNKRRTYELNEAITESYHSSGSEELLDAEKICDVLNELSEEKQKIVQLRFWGDLKFAEIAEQMEKSEAAVKKMFYRTIEEIKNRF